MSDTVKYKLERSYINGGNVVDPIDQITFQKPLYVDGYPEVIDIDLSLSNFFIIDLEDENTDHLNPRNVILNPINLNGIQRFEVLFIEPLGIRNFASGDNDFQFPTFYQSAEFGNRFTMEVGLRREMLITFKVIYPTSGDCSTNTSPIFLGDMTPWFDSKLLYSYMVFMVTDQFENPLDGVVIELFKSDYFSDTQITTDGFCSFVRPKDYTYSYSGSFETTDFDGVILNKSGDDYIQTNIMLTI